MPTVSKMTKPKDDIRFKNLYESDSTGPDFDAFSNNGSFSDESEDHKEKVVSTTTSSKQETIIPGADNDKREKMRVKNERKHQRQREKRVLELYERCCQYLISRKLQVLTQEIVAMGISHERATYALMINQGKLEESVNWLFDNDNNGANVAADKKPDSSLKLDISEELSRILELETKYKSTKQDVEKAVVQADGDIDKAEESLRTHKQEQEQSTVASLKADDVSKALSQKTENTVASLQSNSGVYPSSYVSRESGNRNVISLDRIQTQLQWIKMQQNHKKHITSVPQPTEEETLHVEVLSEKFKRLQQQEMRDQVMMMQQQQQHSRSVKTNMLPVSTAGSSSLYPASRPEAVRSNNGYLPTRTQTNNDLNSNLIHEQLQYQQHQGQVKNSHRTVAPAASLGLFSWYGSSSSPRLDWNMDGSMRQLDYNNIDWSLDKSLTCPRPSQQQYVAASPYETHINGRTGTMGNGDSMCVAMGMQDSALVGKAREWTSPFEGRDLFSFSRQFV